MSEVITAKVETDLQAVFVPIADIQPNRWNPNVQSEFIREKTILSILQNGMVDTIKVREIADGYEIVDGEHRWQVAKDLFPEIKRKGKSYSIEYEFTNADGDKNVKAYRVAKEWAQGLIPVYSYGKLSDEAAQELTLILNGTRGESNPLKLGTLIQELRSTVGEEETERLLPYNKRQQEDFISRVSFDWKQFQQAQVGDLEEVYTDEAWPDFEFLVPPDARDAVDEELERLVEYLDLDPRLPRDMRHGLALVEIAKLSAMTPTESLE